MSQRHSAAIVVALLLIAATLDAPVTPYQNGTLGLVRAATDVVVEIMLNVIAIVLILPKASS